MTILSKHRRALLDAGKYEELRATLPPRTPNRSAIARLAWQRKKKLAAQVKGSKQRNIVRKKRSASEFARIYGSKARVEWVKSQPCVVADSLFCDPTSENAHTETGGTGRKADCTTIAPVCHYHHRLLHSCGVQWFERSYCVDLKAAAIETEQRWRAECARRGIE